MRKAENNGALLLLQRPPSLVNYSIACHMQHTVNQVAAVYFLAHKIVVVTVTVALVENYSDQVGGIHSSSAEMYTAIVVLLAYSGLY